MVAPSRLRDKVIAVTPEGKRIFGYNDKGTPVCYSKRPGSKLRCMATQTMSNGRCRKHGGKSPSGIMHYNATHLRTSEALPKYLQGDMRLAGQDPDLLDNRHEIKLLDLYEKQLTQELDCGLTENGMKKLAGLITELNDKLEDGGSIDEEFLTEIVTTYRGALSQKHTFNEIRKLALDRSRLTTAVHLRERDLKQFMKAEQVYALVTSIGHACKEGIVKVMAAINKRYRLIDKSTGEEVLAVSDAIRLDFMGDIHHALGSLIGQPRSSAHLQPVPEGADVIDAEM